MTAAEIPALMPRRTQLSTFRIAADKELDLTGLAINGRHAVQDQVLDSQQFCNFLLIPLNLRVG